MKEKEDAISQVQKKCSEEMYALENRLNEELTVQREKGAEVCEILVIKRTRLFRVVLSTYSSFELAIANSVR